LAEQQQQQPSTKKRSEKPETHITAQQRPPAAQPGAPCQTSLVSASRPSQQRLKEQQQHQEQQQQRHTDQQADEVQQLQQSLTQIYFVSPLLSSGLLSLGHLFEALFPAPLGQEQQQQQEAQQQHQQQEQEPQSSDWQAEQVPQQQSPPFPVETQLGNQAEEQQVAAAVEPGTAAARAAEVPDGHAASAGAAAQLPEDVRALVADVFGGPAPATVAQVEGYLWRQGVRSFR
jgi:hypothetical protein